MTSPFRIDPSDHAGLATYLIDRGIIGANETPITVSRAGAGNMNLTLRVVTPERRIVVKQGRPWVEKYPEIPAPADRTLVEAAFYRTIAAHAPVASRMPALLHVDGAARIIALEDIDGADFTDLYRGATIGDGAIDALLAYLHALHRVRADGSEHALFANREMRALNHEHIFRFPLAASNGFDLDAITPGLQAAGDALKRDTAFVDRVTALGSRYLADGAALVHGDFFPGSWLDSPRGPIVIDPEFCFAGAAAFDYGVMIAHLMFADQPAERVERVLGAVPAAADPALVLPFAGVEIMRRIIGVAQLPPAIAAAPLARKQMWLDRARMLVRS